MPDIADDRAAYLAAMRRAEEAAGITRDSDGNEQVAGETPVATPEQPEAVPVQASDQPLTPEPEASAEEPMAPDTSEQQQEAPADPRDEKIAELEARLAEKDSFIGRQSTEIGDLRAAVDEIRAAQQAQPVAPPAPQVAITQDMIDMDPARATQLAYAQQDQSSLEVAFNAWKEEDPFTAGQWLTDRRLEQQRQEFDARLQEVNQSIQTVQQPIQQNAEQASWNQAFAMVQAQHPDFLEKGEDGRTTAERILEDVAPQFPATLNALASGDAQAKAEALTLLYQIGRVANPEQVKQELEQAAQQAAEEAAAARAAAGLVVGQTTAGQPPVQKTDEELEQEAYISRMGQRPSLARGWTGR